MSRKPKIKVTEYKRAPGFFKISGGGYKPTKVAGRSHAHDVARSRRRILKKHGKNPY